MEGMGSILGCEGTEKKGVVANGSAKFPKAGVIFWLFTPMEGVFNTCTCPLGRAFDNNIR